MPGQFSVSVCQTEPVMFGLQFEMENQQSEMLPGEIEYLPDFGGIRLSGKLEDASGTVKPHPYATQCRAGQIPRKERFLPAGQWEPLLSGV